MTVRDIAVAFGFDVDKKSVNTAENTIKSIKSFAIKALGAIAIGFSFSALNSIAEEFNGINDEIKDATKELGDQEEIQKKILQAANDTKSSYGDTAKIVSKLVQENNELFGSVDDAVAFHNATTQLFKVAGKGADEVASLQEAINKSFAKGIVDTETINQLLEKSPEAVKLLCRQLGTTSDQIQQMASNGAIALSDLKNAFVDKAAEISQDFDSLDYSISDAMLNIRNSWGLFVNELWVGSGITNGVGKMMVRAFNGSLDVIKKLQPYIERVIQFLLSGVQKVIVLISKIVSFAGRLVNKIGGVENALKLVAIVAGTIWFLLNAGKILNFLKVVISILSVINLEIFAIIAVIVILALAIEDFINFVQGNDSVIGLLFDKAGIGADNARETILKAWNAIKGFLLSVWDFIKQAAKMYTDAVREFFERNSESIRANFERVWGIIKTFLNGVWSFISQLAAALFGDTEDSIDGSTSSTKEKLLSVWQAILDALSAVWDALYAAGSAIFNAFATVIETVFGWIQTFWNAWGSRILSWFKTLWNSLGDILNGFLDIIKGVANFISSVFTGDWQGAWEAIKQIFTGVWNVIVSFITAIWDTIKMLFEMGLSAVKSIWEFVWGAISGFFEGIWNGIVSFLNGIISGITTTVGNIKDTIVNGIQAAIDWIKSLPLQALQWGADIITGIANGIKGTISKVTDAVSGVADKIKSFLHFSVPDEGPLTDFQSWMPDFMSGLASGIGENEDMVLDKVKGLANGISTLMKGVTASAATAAGGAVNKTSNTTNVTQNNTFNNSYSGNDTQAQKNVSKGMNKSAQDATSYMARGLAYAR